MKETLRTDLNHDRAGECVVWTRCGPDEPSPLSDGGWTYPVDTLEAFRANGGEPLELYSNRESAEAERLEDVSPVVFTANDQRIVTRATSYGTGNIQSWAVIDLLGDAARRWTAPPLETTLAALLVPGEHIGKQYEQGVIVHRGSLELTWLIYRSEDPNCCPMGGLAKVRLLPGPSGLRVERAWREPAP